MSGGVVTVSTKPFEGQKPGTSGLRKKVTVFQQPNYTENFVQAILDAIPAEQRAGCTLVVGGDGRFFNKEALRIIISLGFANGVKRIVTGQEGILSTPAVSVLVRKLKCQGAIILTASHNPGGPKNDFGIKYNMSNGGPAPEAITEAIYQHTLTIKEYRRMEMPNIDLSRIGVQTFGEHAVEVMSSVDAYVERMQAIFDFALLKKFIAQYKDSFSLLFDGMNGVTGPYAKRIFCGELGLSEASLMRCTPLEDFGGDHPDPNLTYAHGLVERVAKDKISFAAASDGDGDRNMIISHDAFVNPSDSVAVIAANYEAIPYFVKSGLKGLARSMPTSTALDWVAKKLNVSCYEVPTGWKFFGNLMDAGKLSICGEESFGTGSDHIREKDGIWAVLAWLSIIAHHSQRQKRLVPVSQVLAEHWKTYGRNYFSRYDYEDVSSEAGDKVMARLRAFIADGSYTEKVVGKKQNYGINHIDDFEYTDPIDGSISRKQGIRVLFDDGSRIIYRLSGTGSSGATIRIYLEKYEADPTRVSLLSAKDALADLSEIALDLSDLTAITGRKDPTVIT